MQSLYKGAAWAVAAPLALWCTFLALGISPYFQRHFLYAHRVLPWWQDADRPQKWGFAKNQVTPFALTTEDGESIYAWHVLPLPMYKTHEQELLSQPSGFCEDFTAAQSFRILRDDPSSKLILYFHGNAGHLPNAIRAPSFHTFTDATNYHLIAIDYRGFGKSTGSPTEAGLIRDASSAVDFVLDTAGLSPERVVILGQSLGTAVAAAVAERYAQRGIDFASVVLVAGFSSLPTMLAGYAIAGWVPVLWPLRVWPRALEWVMGFVADTWRSADRLESLVKTVTARAGHLRLSLVHAADDWDIPCHEDDKLFAAAVSGFSSSEAIVRRLEDTRDTRALAEGERAFVLQWTQDDVTIRQELFPYGGHNDIMMYAPVSLEIMRSFELAQAEDAYE